MMPSLFQRIVAFPPLGWLTKLSGAADLVRHYPGDVLVTFDIIFLGCPDDDDEHDVMDGEVPFKEVIHALVRDERARKCQNPREM